MSENPCDIQSMLRESQAGGETTGEFAFICLRLFRDDCAEVLTWQKTLGRRYVVDGHDPEAVRRVVEEDIAKARGDLHDRLVGLLGWARRTGRM